LQDETLKQRCISLKWIFHNPDFAYECYHPTILNISAWLGHRHFAYDLIRFMKPDTLVELGTHWGASFFSFCQAVADDDQVQTDCYAVDTWEGDPHAGLYTNEVYVTVSRVTEQLYAHKASLIRKTFDEAANDFEDETVQSCILMVIILMKLYHTIIIHGCPRWHLMVSSYSMIYPAISRILAFINFGIN
jgi:hypothetical protein